MTTEKCPWVELKSEQKLSFEEEAPAPLTLKAVAKQFEKGKSVNLDGATNEFCFSVAFKAFNRFNLKTGQKLLDKEPGVDSVLSKDTPAEEDLRQVTHRFLLFLNLFRAAAIDFLYRLKIHRPK